MRCKTCGKSASLLRSVTRLPSCRECFTKSFEDDVYELIMKEQMIVKGDRVSIGVSGGKDSSVLAHVLCTINDRYDCGWDLHLLAIDEGIRGYREDSLKVVSSMYKKYNLELKVLNFKERYGFTMDQIVELIGKKGNCTICGTFRRQILEIGSRLIGANKLCTGHNADDMAETVLLNIFRGDLLKLTRASSHNSLKRIKPLMYSFEKEIVLYARYLGLEYFSTECVYSPEAYRGYMRSFIKNLELIDPKIILNILKSGKGFQSDLKEEIKNNKLVKCQGCNVLNLSNKCKCCRTVDTLKEMEKLRDEHCKNMNASPDIKVRLSYDPQSGDSTL